MFTMSDEEDSGSAKSHSPTDSRQTSGKLLSPGGGAPSAPAPAPAAGPPMNTAGRYQSRRSVGRALDTVVEQELQVRTEQRRGSIQQGAAGRRRSVPIPEIHFEVTTQRSGADDDADPTVKLQAMLHANKRRQLFLEAIRERLTGDSHQQMVLVHSDILARTIPPQLTLELYREVTPILAGCVKSYARSLGRNHRLTAECIERHQECAKRLDQLEKMHAPEGENHGQHGV